MVLCDVQMTRDLHEWPAVQSSRSPSAQSSSSQSSTPQKWQPPGKFLKEINVVNSIHRRSSRSCTTRRSITCRRHVSPTDSAQSAEQLQEPLAASHEVPACVEEVPPVAPQRSLARLNTASRWHGGLFGLVQRVWHAVAHAADSWWSKLRAVVKGTSLCFLVSLRM